jgi:hypothetical protein
MTPRTFAASLLLALSLAGCGQVVNLPQAPQGPQDPQGPQSASTACTALFEAYSGWTKGCFGTTLGEAEMSHLVTSCTERAALPGIGATLEAIQGCGARIAASSCAALPADCILSEYPGDARPSTLAFLTSDDEAADHLFPLAPGQLASGTACDIAAQCQSGSCSSTFSYDFDRTCGVCVDQRNAGEACDANSVCNYGSSCTDGVCKSWGDGLGAACQSPKGDSNCLPDLYCPDTTCVPRLQVGDACNGGDGSHDACLRGAVCSAGVCQLVVEGKAGDGCDDVVVHCGSGMFCAEGHCRAPVANVGLGGACVGDICEPGLRCRDNVCATPAQAGEPCYLNSQCAPGLICPALLVQMPTCQAPRAEGQPCESEDACDHGLTCGGSTPMMPVCVRKGAAGDACDDSDRCWPPLGCYGGVCGDLGVCSTP